AKSDELSKSN
ncbi:hypothetical protein A2U01_0070739, partial [Trifolium medium]|nr:hypothetical protein [Trifolium medium]